MPLTPADAQRIVVIIGVLCALLTLAVWSQLRAAPRATSVRLWTVGALAMAAATVLNGQREALPVWAQATLMSGLLALSMSLRTLALRHHIGLPLAQSARRHALALVGAMAGNGAVRWVDDARLQIAYISAVFAGFTLVFAWQAWQVWRHTRSPSVHPLVWAECALAVAFGVRVVAVWFTLPPSAVPPGQVPWDVLLLMVAFSLAAVYGNVGYLGLALDDLHRERARTREAQQAEAQARAAAEAGSEALRVLADQHQHLARERQRMLDLLGHELRQPLHSAGGALQAARTALQRLPAGPPATEADNGVQQAQQALVGVRSLMDNTLAAAALLSGHHPLMLQEVELGFLADLTLGDLSEQQRAQVQVQCRTDLRSAECDPGLMRLALRNLLLNAFKHGGPVVPVTLWLAEAADASALVFSVTDEGPGASDAVLAEVCGPAGGGTPGRGGLGLWIVREVARRHGGELSVCNRRPHGLQASVHLPLPVALPA